MQLADNVGSVLGSKGREVWSVDPDSSVYDALLIMAEKDIGALLVMRDGRLEGVLSERDYARKVILLGKTSRETAVHEIMRLADVTVNLETTVDECMHIMTHQRVRHLPVIENARVIGILSIGDLVNWIIRSQEESIRHLHAYVSGSYPV
jgi:CBS domain-containing protein